MTGAGTPPTRETKRSTGVATDDGVVTGAVNTCGAGGVAGGKGKRTVGRVGVTTGVGTTGSVFLVDVPEEDALGVPAVDVTVAAAEGPPLFDAITENV